MVTNDADSVVATTDLTKRYGRGERARTAVDRVSMTVRRGEVYGFLGPNGAGKTTTLRMMVGLVRPTAGQVEVLGHPAGASAATTRLGALIEGPGFFPYLSGRDNLRVVARYRGLSDRAADQALDRVDLSARAGDRFKSYSLGMKQRLGVAAALMSEPDVVVLDEPTNGLDPGGMAEMRRLVVHLAAGGQTVLLSSHLLDEVQAICDRVGVIHEGRLLRESTVSDLRGTTSLHVRGTPVEDTLAVAMVIAGEDQVRLDGATVVLDTPAERAPELARRLVEHGVDVHEISRRERSLEEVFFELTATKELEAVQ